MTLNFIEDNFILNGNGSNAPFRFYRKGFRLGKGQTPSYQDIILSGTTALTLSNSLANGLNYLKLFGGTEQRNIPAEYTQVNGVTNIGADNVAGYIDTGIVADVDDMEYDVVAKINSNTTASWYILQSRTYSQAPIYGISGSQNGNTIICGFCGASVQSPSITRQQDHTYHVNFKCKNGNATLYVEDLTTGTNETATEAYTFSAATTNTGLFSNIDGSGILTTQNTSVLSAYIKKSGVKVMDYVSCKDSNNITGFYDKATSSFKGATAGGLMAESATVPSPLTPMDIVCNNGVIKYSTNLFDGQWQVGIYSPSTGEYSATNNRICNVNIMKVSPSTNYTVSFPDFTIGGNFRWVFYKSDKTFASAITNGNTTITTPANAEYLNVYIATDLTTAQAPDMQIEKGDVATAYNSHIEGVYTEGIVETIADSLGNTANAERLLAVGDYKDTQEVISGSVTRNIGIKVLDGTEDWIDSGFYMVIKGATASWGAVAGLGGFCTHLTVLKSGEMTFAGACRFATDFNIYEYKTAFGVNDITEFKQYLATQYANGTPVTIVYPLATPTEETVTAQPLTTQAGTNIVEITQASIENLGLEVSYKATI